MRLNLGSTGVMRGNVRAAIAALVEIVEAGGGTVAFVVMANKRALDGSFLPEGSGMLIAGLRGLPAGWAYPENLQYQNVFNTGDEGQTKTLWSATGQFIENPADSYARKMAGGLEACNNCRVLTGGHKSFPDGTRCLFDKTTTVVPPSTYTPNYSIAQYKTNLMRWVTEEASQGELEGLRLQWCRGCIEVGVRCDLSKRCAKIPCKMIERGDQAEVTIVRVRGKGHTRVANTSSALTMDDTILCVGGRTAAGLGVSDGGAESTGRRGGRHGTEDGILMRWTGALMGWARVLAGASIEWGRYRGKKGRPARWYLDGLVHMMIMSSGVPVSRDARVQIVGGITSVSKIIVMLGAKTLDSMATCVFVTVVWVRKRDRFGSKNVTKPKPTTGTTTVNGMEPKDAIGSNARSRHSRTAGQSGEVKRRTMGIKQRTLGVKQRTLCVKQRTLGHVDCVADVLYGWWWLSGMKDTAARDGLGGEGLTACGLCDAGHARRRLPAEVMARPRGKGWGGLSGLLVPMPDDTESGRRRRRVPTSPAPTIEDGDHTRNDVSVDDDHTRNRLREAARACRYTRTHADRGSCGRRCKRKVLVLMILTYLQIAYVPVIKAEVKGLGRSRACPEYDGPRTVITFNCNGLGVHKKGRDAEWGGGKIQLGKGVRRQEVRESTFFPPVGEGWDGGESTEETGKASRIRAYFKEKECLIMGLQETKHEDTTAAARYLTDGDGLRAWGTPGVRRADGKGAKRLTAGVMLMWDEAAGVRCIKQCVVMKHRIISALMELPDGTRIRVVVAYMDGAKARGRRARKAEEERWSALQREVGGTGVVLLGDLNTTRHEQGWAGEGLRGVVAAGGMSIRGSGEATHTRGGREIDHVMVSGELAGVASKASTDDMGDITKRDHRAVVVTWNLRQRVEKDVAEERVRIPDMGKMRKEWWRKAGAEMEDRLQGTRRAAADRDARDRLETLQEMIMQAARRALEAQEGEDNKRKEGAPGGVRTRGGTRTGARGKGAEQGGKGRTIEGRVARLRANVRKWRTMANAARAYDGGGDRLAGGATERMWDDKTLRGIMINEDLTEEERAEVVRAHIDAEHDEANRQLEGCAMATSNKFVSGIREAVMKAGGGGILVAVHKFLRHHTDRGAGGGDAKLRTMRVGGGGSGEEVTEPEKVREEARRYGEQQLGNPGQAWIGAVRAAMKWVGGGNPGWEIDSGSDGERAAEEKQRAVQDAVEKYLTWEAFDRAVGKAVAKKAVGADGFSTYVLKHAPRRVRMACWEEVREVVRTGEVPRAWKDWVAMLAMKPGEEADDLSRRRDLWVVAGMQKIVQTCIKVEYERAGDEMVPGSASGFTALRNGPEQTVVARLAREHAANTRGTICTGWIDYSQLFMSIVKSCQWETERFCGVHPGVTEIVRMLHSEVTGRYETAHGLTERYNVLKGSGQGCINGATRAKLALVLTQRVVEKACKGFGFALDPTRHICEGWYADDACLSASSPHELRKMMECCWMIAQMSGLQINIKGKKKTAWAGTYWTVDKRGMTVEKDIDCGDWKLRMPNGDKVPQIKMGKDEDVNYYKHLGSEMGPGFTGGQDRVRAKVIARCIGVIGVIGGIKGLGITAMNDAIESAVGGVVDYYGRACVLTWEDMQKVEAARAAAMQRSTGVWMVPRRLLWGSEDMGGMGRKHLYAKAAEALFDQFDRMLAGGAGEPGRAAVETMIADTCYRLGCRGRTPLEWMPAHLEGMLSDESLVEGWLKIKIRSRRIAVQAGGQNVTDRGPLAAQVWEVEDELLRGPRLWESGIGRWSAAETCVYSRLLARLGLIWWADVMNDEGEMESIKEMEARTQRKWTVAEKREYGKIKGQLDASAIRESEVGQAWRELCGRWSTRGRRPVSEVRQDDPMQRLRQQGWAWDMEGIEEARVAPKSWGGWEYKVRWVGGASSWEKGVEMVKGIVKGKEVKVEMERARTRHRRPDGFYEIIIKSARLKRASGVGEGSAATTVSERDMSALWAAFVKYVEMDQGDKGEIPVSNLGVMTTEEGRRSRVTWEVEDAQDMFYGGQEKDPKEKEREGVSKRVETGRMNRGKGVQMTTSDGRAGQEGTDGRGRSTEARIEVGHTDVEQEWDDWEGVEGEDEQGHEPAQQQKGLEEMEDDVRREIELEREMEMEEREKQSKESSKVEEEGRGTGNCVADGSIYRAAMQPSDGMDGSIGNKASGGGTGDGVDGGDGGGGSGDDHTRCRVRSDDDHTRYRGGEGSDDGGGDEGAVGDGGGDGTVGGGGGGGGAATDNDGGRGGRGRSGDDRDDIGGRDTGGSRVTWAAVLGEPSRPSRGPERREDKGGGDTVRGSRGGGKENRRQAGTRSRAGLETRWQGDEPKVMKEGSVRCALAHPELEGEGIVEQARRGERGPWAKSVCDAMWHEEGRGMWKYYTTENEKYSMTEPCLWEMCQDAYLALMMRYDGLESGNGGVRLKDGVMVYMDKDEKSVMRQYGTLQTGQFARRTVALHLQEGFTDVFATDGSKSKTRAAYGVWEGPAQVTNERASSGETESADEVEERMAAGMYGGALPEGWGVTEAEMAAVVRALQIALERDEEEGPGRRVMICTDSQATMRAMETAWRKGRHTGERVDRKGLVTTMVDLRREISREREGGKTRGCVRMVYTPGHRGVAPNAVADAIAKAYLGAKIDEGVMWEMVQRSEHVRPYVYGRADGEWAWEGPDDRRVNVQVRDGIMEWMRRRHGGGGQDEGTTAGAGRDDSWTEVMREVAKGSDTALREAKAEEKEEGFLEGDVIEGIVERREGREAITFGMRVGEIEGIVHGARWRQYAAAAKAGGRYEEGGRRGCPMGCGVKCTIQHVVLSECVACVGTDRKTRLAELQRAITTVDEAMIKPTKIGNKGLKVGGAGKRRAGRDVGGVDMSVEDRSRARGEGWDGQVRAARRAVTRSMARDHVEEKDWEAVRQILGGVVRRPEAAKGWSERETRRRVREIASAIGDIQDWAWKEILGWRERTKEQRSAYITRDEGARAEEEELRGWRMQRKRGKQQRVHDVGRKADWESVLSVNYARWVPSETGGSGKWEYFIKEIGGKVGWVADEIARRVIEEQPEAFGQGEEGMGARLDDLQKQHRALLEARGRQLRGEPVTPTGMAQGKGSSTGWLGRNERAARGRKLTSGRGANDVSTVGGGSVHDMDGGSDGGNGRGGDSDDGGSTSGGEGGGSGIGGDCDGGGAANDKGGAGVNDDEGDGMDGDGDGGSGMGGEGDGMGGAVGSGGGGDDVRRDSDGGHLEAQGIGEAIREGWIVGVCGWQHKAEQGVSNGEGGVQGSTVPCDFITEFIAPGGGHGRRGAGTRLLHELWRRGGARADGEIHGYVWRGNAKAQRWWGRRGLDTVWKLSLIHI